jgi:hypothetical protein
LDIVTPHRRGSDVLHLPEPALRAPLAAIEKQIDAAIAPLRADGKVRDEPISFAIWHMDT